MLVTAGVATVVVQIYNRSRPIVQLLTYVAIDIGILEFFCVGCLNKNVNIT